MVADRAGGWVAGSAVESAAGSAVRSAVTLMDGWSVVMLVDGWSAASLEIGLADWSEGWSGGEVGGVWVGGRVVGGSQSQAEKAIPAAHMSVAAGS